MGKKYILCFCIDKEANTSFEIMSGTLEEITSYTIEFSDSSEIKRLYSEKIEKFMKEHEAYIKEIEKKTHKKETGDITIIEQDQSGRRRRRVLYKKHLIVVEEIIREKYPILGIEKSGIKLETKQNSKYSSEYLKTIRRIYRSYKEQYKSQDLPSPNEIYSDYINRTRKAEYSSYIQYELPICESPCEEPEEILAIKQEDYGLPNTSIYDDLNTEPEGYEIHPHDQPESKKYPIKCLKY